MCRALPGEILEKYMKDGQPKARVSFAGNVREVDLSLLDEEEVQVGTFILGHVGVALRAVHPDDAKITLSLFEKLSALGAGEGVT